MRVLMLHVQNCLIIRCVVWYDTLDTTVRVRGIMYHGYNWYKGNWSVGDLDQSWHWHIGNLCTVHGVTMSA